MDGLTILRTWKLEELPLAPSGLEQIADITRKSCGIEEKEGEEKESDRLEAKYLTVSPRGRTQLAISAEGGSFGRVLIKEYLLCQYLHSSREDEQEWEGEERRLQHFSFQRV